MKYRNRIIKSKVEEWFKNHPSFKEFGENGYLSDRDEIVNKRLRKYYHLEKKGEEFYEATLAEYRKISEGVNMITQGGVTEWKMMYW